MVKGVFGCFFDPQLHGFTVSLNSIEQRLWEYIQGSPDERQHWLDKVRRLSSSAANGSSAAARIESELWNYYVERANVVPAIREQVRREGLSRTSMRNLAEYLVQFWIAPDPRKKTANLRRD